MEVKKKEHVAKALTLVAKQAITSSADSRCMFVFHQPKQPKELSKYKKA